MNIIPAIDLRNSQCVRLYKGDFDQQTVYADDPVSVAKEFETQGAKYIHIVDLDGAKNQKLAQTSIIKQIVAETNLKVQTGGGIRNSEQIAELLKLGVDKVIIGSVAVKNPQQMQTWLQDFGGEKIIAAFDVKIINGIPMPAISGWQQQSQISVWDVLEMYQNSQLKYVLCTDIDCDGTLNGPNFSLYKELVDRYPNLSFQASGGITSVDDIKKLKDLGISSVIIGKSLYEGKLTIEDICNVN